METARRSGFSARWTAALLWLLAAGLCQARQEGETATNDELAARREEVRELFATQVPRSLERLRIPGAVVAVVEEGEVVLAEGYGFADLGARRPMTADTVIRAASVSKVFTATAVLRLVEEGRLDLGRDVNHYLDSFQLEETYPDPVVVEDLLVHTGGLDELYIGTGAREAADRLALADYLRAHVPRRVLPPGMVIAYSNQGSSLAGYLVELASGDSFERYVIDKVFLPLGMRHSSFSLNEDQEPRLAVGYAWESGAYRPLPHDYPNQVPAIGLLTSASDMARFMIEVLRGEVPGAESVLADAVARGLTRQRFTHHPALPGRTYCCFERFDDGRRMVGHEGDIRGFAAGMYLFPDHRLGLFIAGNREGPVLRESFLNRFLDARFQGEPSGVDDRDDAVSAPPATPSDRLAGTYRAVRYPRETMDKLSVLVGFAPQVTVSPGNPGLTVAMPGEVLEVEEVEPGLFLPRKESSRRAMSGFAFHENERGIADFLFFGDIAAHRLRWYEENGFQLGLAGVLLLVFASACVISAVWTWRRREGSGRPARRMVAVAGLMSLLNLVFLGGLAAALAGIHPYEFTYGVPAVVQALLVLPPVSAALALVLPVLVALARRGTASRVLWIYCSLVALAGLALVPVMLYWNLLDYWWT